MYLSQAMIIKSQRSKFYSDFRSQKDLNFKVLYINIYQQCSQSIDHKDIVNYSHDPLPFEPSKLKIGKCHLLWSLELSNFVSRSLPSCPFLPFLFPTFSLSQLFFSSLPLISCVYLPLFPLSLQTIL